VPESGRVSVQPARCFISTALEGEKKGGI